MRPLFRWSAGIIGAVVLGIVTFQLFGLSIFQRIGLPHEFCYLQDPKLVTLHVTADLLIGLAYVSISCTLGYLVFRASKGIPFHWVFLAFGLFIISCGLTHFMEVLVIWVPLYWLSAFVKLVTAAASVATAIALFPLLPKVFRLIEDARAGERRRVEIEQLNQELERFNYSVAHDLRGPLRSIRNFGDLLMEEHRGHLPAEGINYVERMRAAASRMDALISGLLNYASVGRQSLDLTPVELESAKRAALELLEDDIRHSGAEVVTEGVLPAVMGDETLIQVVFQNLIGNAIKFMPGGTRPRVEIAGERSGAVVRVTITDNGIGIPLELQARAFEMFGRLHPKMSGTGIGLRIVHRAVERLGGEIGLEPPPGGKGTRFWIRLPAVPSAR
ncbi:MAG TPA: ATP-binding protein [Opitutaceae bacterium]|jgi:signal transduction histidine kinase